MVHSLGERHGHCGQDPGGVSAGGTEGQPVRTLSTIGLAACSTPATEAAILPRLVERLSWLVSPAMVPLNDAMALSSSAPCGPNCAWAAVRRLLAAVAGSAGIPDAVDSDLGGVEGHDGVGGRWKSAAAEQSCAEYVAEVGAADDAGGDGGGAGAQLRWHIPRGRATPVPPRRPGVQGVPTPGAHSVDPDGTGHGSFSSFGGRARYPSDARSQDRCR